MRMVRLFLVCLIIGMSAISALALTPMDDADLDSVQAQSGIAVAIDNVQIYSHERHWGYRATIVAAGAAEEGTIAFEDTASYMIVNTRYPVTFRPFVSPGGVAMVGLEALSYDDGPAMEIVLLANTENLLFCDENLGSLHFKSIPLRNDFNPSLTLEEVLAEGIVDGVFTVDGVTGELTIMDEDEAKIRFAEYRDRNLRGDYNEARMGFMEEFALYVAPIDALGIDDLEGQGIAFQFALRSGMDEFRWDYNTVDKDEFRVGGVYLAGSFDDAGQPLHDPDDWGEPQGIFTIGELSPYSDSGDINPATFRVVPDVDEFGSLTGHAFLRFNLPMKGSIRIEEIEMYEPVYSGVDIIDSTSMDFGPMILDGIDVHYLQVDFKTH